MNLSGKPINNNLKGNQPDCSVETSGNSTISLTEIFFFSRNTMYNLKENQPYCSVKTSGNSTINLTEIIFLL